MAQPEVNGSQLEHGEEVCGVLFVARGESPKVLYPIEEPLDAVARSIEHWAKAGFPAAVNHGRNVRSRTGSFDAAAQPISVVSFISEHDGVGLQPSEQLFGNRTIARLTRCEYQLERQTTGISQRVNLCRQSTAGAAHTAIRVSFFELAAC